MAIRAEGRGVLGDRAGRAGAQSLLRMYRCMHCYALLVDRVRGMHGMSASMREPGAVMVPGS